MQQQNTGKYICFCIYVQRTSFKNTSKYCDNTEIMYVYIFFHFQKDSVAPFRKEKYVHMFKDINLPQHIFAFMVQSQRIIMSMSKFINLSTTLSIVLERDVLYHLNYSLEKLDMRYVDHHLPLQRSTFFKTDF